MMLLKQFAFLFLALNLLACIKDKGKTPEQAKQPTIDTCTTAIKYSLQISRIINSSCAIETCHVPTGYKDFSTYETLRSEIDRLGKTFFIKIIQPEGTMPPTYSTGQTLHQCDINKLETWLNEGYSKN